MIATEVTCTHTSPGDIKYPESAHVVKPQIPPPRTHTRSPRLAARVFRPARGSEGAITGRNHNICERKRAATWILYFPPLYTSHPSLDSVTETL